MLEFAEGLSATGLSHFIQSRLWVIPALQSIHILAIAMLMSAILFVSLRLLGRAWRDATFAETTARFMPWVWGALAVLIATGGLLVSGEPKRELLNPSFWTKMVLVVGAVALLGWFAARLRRDGPDAVLGQAWTRPFAFGLLGLFAGIITAGRLIAYVY